MNTVAQKNSFYGENDGEPNVWEKRVQLYCKILEYKKSFDVILRFPKCYTTRS